MLIDLRRQNTDGLNLFYGYKLILIFKFSNHIQLNFAQKRFSSAMINSYKYKFNPFLYPTLLTSHPQKRPSREQYPTIFFFFFLS